MYERRKFHYKVFRIKFHYNENIKYLNKESLVRTAFSRLLKLVMIFIVRIIFSLSRTDFSVQVKYKGILLTKLWIN